MAQVRIPVEVLPPPNKNGDHVVQFRVLSDDRNKISAWSSLYTVKSIGQYRPYESTETFSSSSASKTISITWDTPTIYNYSASLTSASISHNHTQNYKQHDTDIFIQWNPSASTSYWEYHDRVASDTTVITYDTQTSVRVVGTVATHGIPVQNIDETDSEYSTRLNNYLTDLLALFKVFDTGTKVL